MFCSRIPSNFSCDIIISEYILHVKKDHQKKNEHKYCQAHCQTAGQLSPP